MSDVRMELIPGQGCRCTGCACFFEARRDDNHIIVRHAASWDADLPYWLVYLYAACPLQALRFRHPIPSMEPVTMERVA